MMLGRIVRDVTYIRRARGWRRSSNKNKNRSSYAWISAPESMASIDIEGTTTIVCASWLNRSIDFHNGTSFFWSRSKSVCVSATDDFIFEDGKYSRTSAPSARWNALSQRVEIERLRHLNPRLRRL